VPDARPLVWLDLVGLTPRLLEHAPNLKALAARGASRPLGGVVPAVTCTAQATALTGALPQEHGVVGNGWYRPELGEVRFWVQAQAQLLREPVYATLRRQARREGRPFTAAKLFWWFNQGAPVDLAVTPKPWYGADGSKVFGIQGEPGELAPALEEALGPFPFHAFWGPRAGLPASDWIAAASAWVLREKRPSFTLVYLPHLDYDLQRFGPEHPGTPARVAELDRAAAVVLDAARAIGAAVVGFSEYGIQAVTHAITPNRALRQAGLLAVRDGPFGEGLDLLGSRAFAVCDHQLAHVHVRDAADLERVRDLLAALPGVSEVLAGPARARVGLDHPRSGDLVLLARRDAWFAYPWWLDDARAPDFARTVDIHRKPGYDPLELFVDPTITFPRVRVLRRLLAKKLGLRYLMDVVPLDTSLIKGSHGVPPAEAQDGPLVLADEAASIEGVGALTDLSASALRHFSARSGAGPAG
jgi:predicted AlkP superfamily pyrophosphatase or phosphodiesterase